MPESPGLNVETTLRPSRLQQLYQRWLAHVHAAKFRFAHGAIASIPGSLVNGERCFVFFGACRGTLRGSQRLAMQRARYRVMRGPRHGQRAL